MSVSPLAGLQWIRHIVCNDGCLRRAPYKIDGPQPSGPATTTGNGMPVNAPEGSALIGNSNSGWLHVAGLQTFAERGGLRGHEFVWWRRMPASRLPGGWSVCGRGRKRVQYLP